MLDPNLLDLVIRQLVQRGVRCIRSVCKALRAMFDAVITRLNLCEGIGRGERAAAKLLQRFPYVTHVSIQLRGVRTLMTPLASMAHIQSLCIDGSVCTRCKAILAPTLTALAKTASNFKRLSIRYAQGAGQR